MKIGIFDSGVGGLIIAKAVRKLMPKYDYVYLGDTKRVPYGNRPHKEVFEFTKEAVDYLFRKENCAIVIIACNTASARALRRIQQEYLSKNFVDRKVLGVLVPAAEEAAKFKRIGVLGTLGTVASLTFPKEIKKINPEALIFQNAAPMLVPLAEAGDKVLAGSFIAEYLQPFSDKKLQALILGCTHYPIFKSDIKREIGKKVEIISQDEIVPKKLKDYFAKHYEISKKLSCNGKIKILVTKKTDTVDKLTRKWFGKVLPKLIRL